MKIGIFGGTFNPIHKGHVEIAKMAIDELGLDRMIFVPTFVSAFRTKEKMESGEDRAKMIELVLPEKSEISMFEVNRKSVSYTFETIKYFKHKFPNDQLFFVIGSDNLSMLHKWEEIDYIATATKIVVARRTKNFNKINAKKFNAIILKNKLVEFSSTDYKKNNLHLVNKKVQQYIGKHCLYVENLIKGSLSHIRGRHCLFTADFAKNLAKKHGYDAQIAYVAGAFHDITKEWSNEKHEHLFKRYLDYTPEKHQYHQISAMLWLKHCYMIDNPLIEHAISIHTTLDLEMNWLDKIVYLADKLSRGRRWPGIEAVRRLAFEDLDKSFAKIVAITYQNLKDKGVYLDEKSVKIYEKWSKS